MKNLFSLLLLFTLCFSFTNTVNGQDSCSVFVWQDTLVDPNNGNGILMVASPTGTPPFTYQWDTGDTTDHIYVWVIGVEYCVTITDAIGCVAVDCEIATIPWLDCNVYINQIYNGTNVVYQAIAYGGTPPYQYFWSNGETTQEITPDSIGEYCVYTVDADSCVSEEACWYYQGQSLDSCSAFISGLPNTQGGEDLCAYTDGPGPFTYLWSTGETNWLINVQQPGTYCVTVIDASGCEADACYYYSGNNNQDSCIGWISYVPVAGVGEDLAAFSSGPSPYTYSWSTGETSMTISVQQEGLYCVTVVDADGCETIPCYYYDGNTGNPDSCFAFISGLPSSQGGEDLCAYSSNPGPYTYLWSTGQTEWLINVQQEGNYCVTVTDGFGCEASACYYFPGVTNPDPCSVFIAGDSLGFSNGVIWAVGSGIAPYTYLWNTGETTQSVTVTVEGPYCVTITDSQGCVAESNCVWAYPPNPDSCSVFIYQFQDTIDGTIYLDALVNGVGPFTYLWSNGETNPTIMVTQADTFCVTVTNAAGCSATECIYVDPGVTGCSVFIFDTLGNNGDVFLYADSPANGPTPFSYLWSTGETAQVIAVTNPGTYCVTLTDGNGCQAFDCFYYAGAPNLNNICGAVFLADSLSQLGSTTVSLYLLENGGTTLVDEQYFQGEAYFWGYNFDNLPDGDYIVRAAIDAGALGSAEYVPTYHLDALMWDDADVITLPSNLPYCEGTIIMQPDGGVPPDGAGAVAGNVHDSYGNISGVTILLYDEFGNLIDYVYTDANGEYAFYNLPLGTYQIVIEYTGFNHASYWVTLTDDEPRIIGLNFEVLDGAITTGIFELAVSASLKVYPNPVQDFVRIELEESWGSDLQISIFNLNGKRLKLIEKNNAGQIAELNLADLKTGMYFYQINDGKQMASGKLIKQ